MNSAWVLLLMFVMAMGLFSFDPSSSRAETRTCQAVVFEVDSENATSPIKATGVDCRTARAVAGKSDASGLGPTGNVGERHTYTSRGFKCRGVELDSVLPSVAWRCSRKKALITFTKG